MGTQGSSRPIARREAAGQGRRAVRAPIIMCALTLGPMLAACASVASLSPGPNQPAAVSQAGAPPVAQPVSMTTASNANDGAANTGAWPKQSLLDAFRDDSPPPATAAPGSRNVAAASPSADDQAHVTPYPSKSLIDVFREDSAASAPAAPAATGTRTVATQNAYVPHPPSTYTASGQPYVPPAGQPNYGAPQPPAQPAPAAPEPPPPTAGAYPSQSLFDIFSNKSASQ